MVQKQMEKIWLTSKDLKRKKAFQIPFSPNVKIFFANICQKMDDKASKHLHVFSVQMIVIYLNVLCKPPTLRAIFLFLWAIFGTESAVFPLYRVALCIRFLLRPSPFADDSPVAETQVNISKNTSFLHKTLLNYPNKKRLKMVGNYWMGQLTNDLKSRKILRKKGGCSLNRRK